MAVFRSFGSGPSFQTLKHDEDMEGRFCPTDGANQFHREETMAANIEIAVYTNSDDAFVAWAPERVHPWVSRVSAGAGSQDIDRRKS